MRLWNHPACSLVLAGTPPNLGGEFARFQLIHNLIDPAYSKRVEFTRLQSCCSLFAFAGRFQLSETHVASERIDLNSVSGPAGVDTDRTSQWVRYSTGASDCRNSVHHFRCCTHSKSG